MTVMGDALMERLSDAGSIPARSIEKRRVYGAFFEFALHFEPRLCLDAKRYLVSFHILGKKGVPAFSACEAMLHERGHKRERA